MPPVSQPLAAYEAGTKAWFPDEVQGWVSGTLTKEPAVDQDGNVSLLFNLDESGDERVVPVRGHASPRKRNAHLPPCGG